MHLIKALPFVVLPLLAIGLAPADLADPLLGFSNAGSAAQRELEARFDSELRADNLREWMKRMTARPRHLGAPYTKEMAEFIASLFRSWGYETRIEEFRVLFPTPRTRLLELVEPRLFTAKLEEPAIPEDATSDVRENLLPLYNAYSADGDVTAELVYVNYGVPDDYEELDRRGIDVAGKIVIARYGGSWRGIKPKVAAEHGAIGTIIYSDPHEDGYFQGEVYPEGPYRPEYGGQRGSVADMPTYPGDPLTPDVGATADAERLPVEESPTIMKIPVLPISYGDARPLLEALGGTVAPETWRGALPLTYHIGPGPAKVHLKLEFDWDLVTAHDVIAMLRGSALPDEWIVRGNHFDGWAFGARDPISGMVAALEEARAIATLTNDGWRPKRTIVYAAWDGEEPGLLGSTEWAEAHAEELRRKVVAYINSDSNSRGFLQVGGSHTLERFINEVAEDVSDPQTGVSVAERLRALREVRGDRDPGADSDLRISPLGSGSDYTPFLQHLGIASLNLGYGGEAGGGSYHSIYDSFDHYTRFGDPEFQYGVALAKTGGRAVLRLAEAEVLPFRFTNFAQHTGEYIDEIAKLADDMRAETERTNRLLESRAYTLAADPTETYVPPAGRAPVPFLNFAPLRNALAHLRTASSAYGKAMDAAGPEALTGQERRQLNELLLHSERRMTTEEGLPRRPWYVHQIYAPGFYTGYGVKTLPGVREAIEERQWDEAAAQIEVAAATLEYLAAAIDEAAAVLREHPTE